MTPTFVDQEPVNQESFPASPRELPGVDLRSAELNLYRSLIDLRRALSQIEEDAAETVVLALDDWFSGDLKSLLSRERFGGRLVLTSASGSMTAVPGLAAVIGPDSSTGWDSIAYENQPRIALQSASSNATNRVVVFWPAWNRAEFLRAI